MLTAMVEAGGYRQNKIFDLGNFEGINQKDHVILTWIIASINLHVSERPLYQYMCSGKA